MVLKFIHYFAYYVLIQGNLKGAVMTVVTDGALWK